MDCKVSTLYGWEGSLMEECPPYMDGEVGVW